VSLASRLKIVNHTLAVVTGTFIMVQRKRVKQSVLAVADVPGPAIVGVRAQARSLVTGGAQRHVIV